MIERTKLIVDLFANLDWFYAVGQPIAPECNVDSVRTWADAIRQAESRRWQNICLEENNKLSGCVLQKNRELHNEWNEKVNPIADRIALIIMPSLTTFAQKRGFPISFVDSVRLNVLDVALRTEYADLCPIGLMGDVAHWYAKGHFPCGYSGRYPKGKLIVF